MIVFIVLGGLSFFVIGAAAYFMTVYNGLVIVKNNVSKAWANIDVLLKQRHDEIPNLIKTCETYMSYERETLAKVISLRQNAQNANSMQDKAAKEGELSAGLARIFALAKNYPNLKTQSSFQQLQSRISSLESDIADRREFYNESVNNYNIRIESMPDSFVANYMALKPFDMFQVSASERSNPDVTIKLPV